MEQSKYVYKGRLILRMYEHKLYIAHTMFQDWICSIIFLVLLSFLVKQLTQQKNHFDPPGKDWSSSNFCCCILKSKLPIDIAEHLQYKNSIAKFSSSKC